MSQENKIKPRNKAPIGTLKITNIIFGILILLLIILSTIIWNYIDFSISGKKKSDTVTEITQTTAGFNIPPIIKKEEKIIVMPGPKQKSETRLMPFNLPNIFATQSSDQQIPIDPLALPDLPEIPKVALPNKEELARLQKIEQLKLEAEQREKRRLSSTLSSGDNLGGSAQDNSKSNRVTALGALLENDATIAIKAKKYSDLSTLLKKGTFINCALDVRISSDQLGYLRCTTMIDTYSADLTRVLLPKGTEITGEIRKGLNVGQKRLFVLFNEFVTPDGVTANLSSPASGRLGASGIGGKVNNHWLERFGSAFLIGFMADFLQSKTSSRNNNNNNNDNVTAAMEQVITSIVEQYSKIPPTLTKHQGSIISVIVNRDIDFSLIVNDV